MRKYGITISYFLIHLTVEITLLNISLSVFVCKHLQCGHGYRLMKHIPLQPETPYFNQEFRCPCYIRLNTPSDLNIYIHGDVGNGLLGSLQPRN